MKRRGNNQHFRPRILLPVVIGIVALTTPIFSQVSDAKPSFDVASIKPSLPGARQKLAIQPGGRFVADGFTLKVLIAFAYHLQAFQVSVGDGWMANDPWSIEAKAEDVSSIPAWAPPSIPEVMAVRLRSLLEDRFLLKTHRETRRQQVYSLTISKNGSKLVATAPPPQPTPGQSSAPPQNPPSAPPSKPTPRPGSALAGPGALIGSALTMDQIVTLLNRLMDLPVIDKTGLTGYFDIRLQFAPESAPRRSAGPPPANGLPPESPTTNDPSIFTAIQEQLGLKLESAKEPVEVLVIDSAQKPSEN